MKELGEKDNRKFHELSPDELDLLMCQFFINAKKISKKINQNSLNDEYEPYTLSTFRNSWHRSLMEHGWEIDIKTETKFEQSRTVLAG